MLILMDTVHIGLWSQEGDENQIVFQWLLLKEARYETEFALFL